MLSQARGEDSSGANFVHLYRGRRSISFRRWCFSSRRRFLFRLYLISSDDFAGSLSGSFVVFSSLIFSRIHIWREGEGPEAVLSFQKPRRSPRPIRSSNSNSTTNYCLSLDRIHIYSLVSLLSFGRGRSRGWTWNPWREWNPREYPSGHACRRAGAVLPSIVDEPADRSRRVD